MTSSTTTKTKKRVATLPRTRVGELRRERCYWKSGRNNVGTGGKEEKETKEGKEGKEGKDEEADAEGKATAGETTAKEGLAQEQEATAQAQDGTELGEQSHRTPRR